MSAFNDLNGVPASANPFTLTQVLRREWKFDGLVVSDYKSVVEVVNTASPLTKRMLLRRRCRQVSTWRW